MITIENIQIQEKDIVDFTNDFRSIIIKFNPLYMKLSCINKERSSNKYLTICPENDFIIKQFKDKLIKRARRQKHPEDRVLKFEWFPDFSKRDILIEMRRTKKEVQFEIDEMMTDVEEYEKHNIDCEFLKRDLKQKIQGNFKGLA